MSEPTWFTRPSASAPGTLNAVYDALDRQVVLGLADEVAVAGASGPVPYAVLLEQVAALGGLLRALGVRLGDPVAVTAPVSAETVVATLAVARIGAVPWVGGAPDDLVTRSDAPLVVAEGAQMGDVARAVDALDPGRPRAVVVVRPGDWRLLETRDVAWDPALRAGATDPASVVAVAPSTAFVVGVAADGEVVHPHQEVARTAAVPAGGLASGRAWSAEAVREVVAALAGGRGVVLDR